MQGFYAWFRPLGGAAGTIWDDLSPDEADYTIVPYHLKAFLNAPGARPQCLCLAKTPKEAISPEFWDAPP